MRRVSVGGKATTTYFHCIISSCSHSVRGYHSPNSPPQRKDTHEGSASTTHGGGPRRNKNNNNTTSKQRSTSTTQSSQASSTTRKSTPTTNNLLVLGLRMGNTGCVSRVISDNDSAMPGSGKSGIGEREEGGERRLVMMPYMAPGDALLLKPSLLSSSSSYSMLLTTGTSSLTDGGIPAVVVAPGTVQQAVRRSALLSSPTTKLCPHRASCGLCPWHHLSSGGSSALKQKRAKEIFPPTPSSLDSESGSSGGSVGYRMVHTSAFPDQSSPHTAARQFTLHLASSEATPAPTPSTSQQHTHKSPRRFDDFQSKKSSGMDYGEFSDQRYDLLDRELKQRSAATNVLSAQGGGKKSYYFGLHNALDEVVPTPSCLVAPLSVTSIANSIIGKLNAAKFATSTLGANLLAVTVIEVPLTQRDMSSESISPSATSRSTAVRVVVLVKSMSAIFEGQKAEELEYMLSLGKLSVSERLLVDAILTATVTCSRVFIDLQETTKKSSSSSRLGGSAASAAAGKVRHLYPTVGVRPRDSDVDVGTVACEAPLIVGSDSGGICSSAEHQQVVEFEMPSALIGLGRGRGLHRFHQGMAASFSVAFTKVSDIVSGLLYRQGSSLSSTPSYEIVVLRGTGAPHTSVALAKAAEDYVAQQHARLVHNRKLQEEKQLQMAAAESSSAPTKDRPKGEDDVVVVDEATESSNIVPIPLFRGSVRPSTHFELNDYIRSLIRSISSNGAAGGGVPSTVTSSTSIVVVAVVSATTDESSLYALWNSCGLTRNITNSHHRRNAPIGGFVLICEGEDAVVKLKTFMANAAARGAGLGRKTDIEFSSTVVDVDRRSASFSLVVSWKKDSDNLGE